MVITVIDCIPLKMRTGLKRYQATKWNKFGYLFQSKPVHFQLWFRLLEYKEEGYSGSKGLIHFYNVSVMFFYEKC